MKRNKWIAGCWILLFSLLYIMTESDAAAAAILFMAAYCVLAAIYVKLAGKRLCTEIEGGGEQEKNCPMEFVLRFRNPSLLPVPWCRVHGRCINILTEEEKKIDVFISLGGRDEQSIPLLVEDHCCGMERVAINDLRLYDPCRIFSVLLSAAGDARGYFLPSVGKYNIEDADLDSYNMESYRYSQYEQGRDTGETFGLREYEDGDSQRAIHWKLSAKMDEMIVRIPSFPIENNIILMLDNCPDEGEEISAEQKSGLVELLYSISATMLDRRIPHSLGWYDHHEKEFCTVRLADRDDMWRTVPQVLEAGFAESSVSVAVHYIETLEGRGYTNYFLVSAGAPRDVEQLENYGAVKIFTGKSEQER